MTEENLDRQVLRLRCDARANAALRSLGISDRTTERFKLGIKAPYRSRLDDQIVEGALSFPIKGADGVRLSRFGFLNLEGVTRNAPRADGWGVGAPLSYWSAVASSSFPLIVVSDVRTLWLLDQLRNPDSQASQLILAPSHPGDMPLEWLEPSFWSDWPSVTVLRDAVMSDELVGFLASIPLDSQKVVDVPHGIQSWAAALTEGMTRRDIQNSFDRACEQVLSDAQGSIGEGEVDLGDFPYEPVELSHAFRDGNLYYPFRVEERTHENVTGIGGAKKTVVQGYAVRVLRSDGKVLKIEELPAPRDAAPCDRVLVLGDGTRIRRRPNPSQFASWSFHSIARYAKASPASRNDLYRPTAELIGEVEANLRSSVLLPDDDGYVIASAYVLLTYVYPVFGAIPLLLIQGTKGSGKTELGQAMATLSCNGVVVGQSSAAGIARLVDELQGLIVFDDLEKIANTSGASSDLLQLLKVGYKRAASTKPLVDRSGRVRTLNFYGPKIVTNTKGVDSILSTRMVTIHTREINAIADPMRAADLIGTDPIAVAQLRDELHCWGLAMAARVSASYDLLPRPVNRRAEIEAPLRAIASLIGDGFAARLDRALRKTIEAAPEVDNRKVTLDALAASKSSGWLSMPQLQLEVALRGGAFDNPESLGRMLSSEGFRRKGEPLRRRLYGMLCRIIPVLGDGAFAEPEEALDFCRKRVCGDCRYQDVCRDVFPDLKPSKLRA